MSLITKIGRVARLIWHGKKPSPVLAVEGIFDSTWYVDHYADVRKSKMDPLLHFMLHGIAEGRMPNAYFDVDFYRAAHRDDLFAQDDPVSHYLQHARLPNHHPCAFFENDWYAQQYLVDQPLEIPLNHFLALGERSKLRPHPLFSEQRYLRLNPEVERDVREGKVVSGFRHFVTRGAAELDAGHYRHFNFEWGRYQLDYDPVAYVADNPDVHVAIAQGYVRSGIGHLFTRGWREALCGLRAIYSTRHQVRLLKVVEGTVPERRQPYLCLFAHYDRDGMVDPYVATYLQALSKMNVEIVFISETQAEAQLAKIKPYVSKFLVKNEAGRDFGSWWLALKTLGLDHGLEYDRVIFANDSIYCPVQPLAPLFTDLETKKFNLYGLSDSRDLAVYHLQSFFLAFDRKAQTQIFPEFIDRFERNYVLTKWGQIREYELGLTQIAQAKGLSVGAYFSIDDCREDVIRDPQLAEWDEKLRLGLSRINPTHDLWNLMIGRYGWPGLKLELLRDNPRHVSGFDQLGTLLEGGQIPLKLIEAHVRRSKTRPSKICPPIVEAKSAEPRLELLRRISGLKRDPAKRLILFAHYDPHHIIDPHIIFQIKALATAGCAVAFITSSSEDQEILKIAPYVRDILVKTDTGRDFGSWAIAVSALKNEFNEFDTVIWMNDSTYFPLFDPANMFYEMERRGSDFWGVVDSYNVKWHVMSWFWAFGSRAISNGWFDWYLDEYNSSHTKWAQIHNYEMRLPGLLKSSGLNVDSYIRAKELGRHIVTASPRHPRLDAAVRGDFSMTHDFWSEVIKDFRCPALKVELVRDNPLGIDLGSMPKFVAEETDYDFNLIRNHLLRLKVGHLPPPSSPGFREIN